MQLIKNINFLINYFSGFKNITFVENGENTHTQHTQLNVWHMVYTSKKFLLKQQMMNEEGFWIKWHQYIYLKS